MEETKETTAQNVDTLPAFRGPETAEIMASPSELNVFDEKTFAVMQRVANLYAAATMLPEHYQKNVSNCFIAIRMAHTLNVDPFVFMQNSYVLKGKPALEGKLVTALMNARGDFATPVDYEYTGSGDTRSCTAFVIRKDGKRLEFTVDVKMAKSSGWYEKNPNWRTLTDLMLGYRAATFLCRLHCPHLLMGMQTREEVIDVEGSEVVVEPRTRDLPKALRAQKSAAESSIFAGEK